MKQKVFRDLRADEIEVRVGNIVKDKDGNPKGFQLLLYKTSRTDMAILDETFGTFGWRNHFYQVKNTMVCSIEVYELSASMIEPCFKQQKETKKYNKRNYTILNHSKDN